MKLSSEQIIRANEIGHNVSPNVVDKALHTEVVKCTKCGFLERNTKEKIYLLEHGTCHCRCCLMVDYLRSQGVVIEEVNRDLTLFNGPRKFVIKEFPNWCILGWEGLLAFATGLRWALDTVERVSKEVFEYR